MNASTRRKCRKATLGSDKVRIAAIRDPDADHATDHAKRIAGKQGSEPKIFKDYRAGFGIPDQV